MITRRNFLKNTLSAGVALSAFPSIVPSSVFGADAPSNRINIGAIGTGRISRSHDIPGVWRFNNVRIVAVADLDARRAADTKALVERHYSKKIDAPAKGVAAYADYRELLASKDVDAVLISTPDHWHAKQSIDAVRAGKDVYLQKPASLTIADGRAMSDAVKASGRILQIGSQQRSMPQFRVACELVRNGRIGELKSIDIRLPGDPAGGKATEVPVPAGFNYDAWLGPTPFVPYAVDRVHPQRGYDRPGWLRCEQFGAGMITGWGAHHFDIAHWAMDRELSGPVEISGSAKFPAAGSGLWDVHGAFQTRMVYDNGVVVTGTTESKAKPNGVLFTGTKGWIFVSRGNYAATASDPSSGSKSKALTASDPSILAPLTSADTVRLYVSKDHHGNWLDSIRTRTANITPAEVGHRACSACLLQHIAMKLGRVLHWDPVAERFKNDDAANALLSRPQRKEYAIS
jgi:predicted dehydrogenase